MSGDMFVEDNSEEDEEGFSLDADGKNSTARLATLFSQDSRMRGNETLTYTAPKQPKGAEEAGKTSSAASSVLSASVVYAFMLKDGKFQPFGKLGLAVVYNTEKNEGKVLLYHANRKPVTQATIGPSCALSVQTDTYISIVDASSNHWSLAFDNHEELVKFSQWYMTCQGSSLGEHVKELQSIDLKVGEGNRVGNGDLVEIEYLEYVIESGPSFTEFNGNINSDQVLRLKIGKKKMPKGWEDGIIGMRKLGQRLFLIPPDVGFSGHASSPTFPTNAPIMVLVSLKRVKFGAAAGHKSHSEKVEAANTAETITHEDEIAENPLAPRLPQGSEDENSGETISSFIEKSIPMLNESLDTEGTDNSEGSADGSEVNTVENRKADLLNRMARIGQPLLPGARASPANASNMKETDAPHSNVLPDLVANEPSKEEEVGIPVSQSKSATAQSKKNPIAVVCAELPSKSRSSSITTVPSTGTASLTDTGAPFSHGAPQHPMPYMFPYPHGMPHAFYPFGNLQNSMNTSTDSNASIPPPHFNPAGFYPFPPSYPPPMGDAHMKQLLEEMRESQKLLQNEIRSMIDESLKSVSKQVLDLNGNLEKTLDSINPPDRSSGSDFARTQDARDQLLAKLEAIERKLSGPVGVPISASFTTANMSSELTNIPEKLDAISAKIAEEHNWREKYETLATQAFRIKAQFEEEILHLKQELARAKKIEEYRINEEEKIKSIMSSFYRSVTEEFDSGETYSSDLIKKMVLKLVKDCTLRVLKSPEKTGPLEEIAHAASTSSTYPTEVTGEINRKDSNSRLSPPIVSVSNGAREEEETQEVARARNHEISPEEDADSSIAENSQMEEAGISESGSEFHDSITEPDAENIRTEAEFGGEAESVDRESSSLKLVKGASIDEMEESFHSTHDSSPSSN